jgi:hypothetical protein
MRYLSFAGVLVLVASLASAQTDAKPGPDFQSASHLFDYDAKQSLDIHDKVIEEFAGGTLHDITYTSPKGGPVSAYPGNSERKGSVRSRALRALGKRHPGRIYSRSQHLR